MSRTKNPTQSVPDRKAKKSCTLSAESLQFLESLREKQGTPSVSSVLESILQAVRRRQSVAALDRSVTEYYLSLTDTDSEELADWGTFAARQLSTEES